MNACVWMHESMNEWTKSANDVYEWMNEWMNEWANEWMKEWMNEWMCDLVYVWFLFQSLINWYIIMHEAADVNMFPF